MPPGTRMRGGRATWPWSPFAGSRSRAARDPHHSRAVSATRPGSDPGHGGSGRGRLGHVAAEVLEDRDCLSDEGVRVVALGEAVRPGAEGLHAEAAHGIHLALDDEARAVLDVAHTGDLAPVLACRAECELERLDRGLAHRSELATACATVPRSA